MRKISIKKFKISLSTASGDYGFECSFENKLNIVRGNNSSGKSTFINSLIYSLGMEEIIGGKGIKILPYALKEYVEDFEKNRIKIISSYVFVEIENEMNAIITLKRSIVSSEKNSKLVEIIQGPYLSEKLSPYKVTPTYLHDKGSAQENGAGFFSYLEKFMKLELPQVATSSDGEAKLYLQTIFSALLIEQKRGWTDYIANTPYYAIRDVRSKIVEFLLNLDVFENERRKNQALSEISNIQKLWSEEKCKIKLFSENNSIIVYGIRESIDDSFDPHLVRIIKLDDGNETPVHSYIGDLVTKIEEIEKKSDVVQGDVPENLITVYLRTKEELNKLSSVLESVNLDIQVAQSRLNEYKISKLGIEKDLEKNKIALKLKNLGAEHNLEIASDICPSCHQPINDSLLLVDTLVQPMSIDENIKYLDNQKKMVAKFISGLEQAVQKLDLQSKGIVEKIADKRTIYLSIKKDLKAFNAITETDIRLKIQLETKVSELTKSIKNIETSINNLKDISLALKNAKELLVQIPNKKMSKVDISKIKNLQKSFRELAGAFGYKSAPTNDIELNNDTLFPYLSGIELREVNTDIKSDSSASDFVRLIWAYLLSIYSVSNSNNGNHPGIIVFDEPAQHSMAVLSVNALLKKLTTQQNLQSIVAASFDESDRVFNESVEGVGYNLITFGTKLLKPL